MRRFIAAFAALAVLAACQQAERPASPPVGGSTAPQGPEGDKSEVSRSREPGPVSCLDERGADAAQALADRCRQVSPATRPPCNAANPCAMIQSEIDRACALWAEDGDAPEDCRP